jgi:hypothetical protein
LASVIQAEHYIGASPVETRRFMQQHLQRSPFDMDRVWSKQKFGVSLPQDLILLMEHQARSVMRNKLTGAQTIPNHLTYVDPRVLDAVQPCAVTLFR